MFAKIVNYKEIYIEVIFFINKKLHTMLIVKIFRNILFSGSIQSQLHKSPYILKMYILSEFVD